MSHDPATLKKYVFFIDVQMILVPFFDIPNQKPVIWKRLNFLLHDRPPVVWFHQNYTMGGLLGSRKHQSFSNCRLLVFKMSFKDLCKIHIFVKFHRCGSNIVPATPILSLNFKRAWQAQFLSHTYETLQKYEYWIDL